MALLLPVGILVVDPLDISDLRWKLSNHYVVISIKLFHTL